MKIWSNLRSLRGILIGSSTQNNLIYHNNFINNTLNSDANSVNNFWDTGSEGNYWDDYDGIDNDGNGIGDTAYTIYSTHGYLNLDNYPLMEPWSSEPYEQIYIRFDGIVDPIIAPIERNGDIYTQTDDIFVPIKIERNNITLVGNGYSIQGEGTGAGITVENLQNITITNTTILGFENGILLRTTSNITISGNNINNNSQNGVFILYSTENTLSENQITNNLHSATYLAYSTQNNFTQNIISANGLGIRLDASTENIISDNYVT